MSKHLTLFIADLSGTEHQFAEDFKKWAESDLLDKVALIDVYEAAAGLQSPAYWVKGGILNETKFGSVLTENLWDEVTLVSLRLGNPSKYAASRFKAEEAAADIIRSSFNTSEIRLMTVGNAKQGAALTREMFSPFWDLHLLHDTKIIADINAAILQTDESDYSVVALMLAALCAGGLRWQDEVLADISDPFMGLMAPARIARGQIRVINAGSFVNDVLAGAFPESGPWTTPRDVKAIQAPIGAEVSDQLIKEVVVAGSFSCRQFKEPPESVATAIGIAAGLKLFIRHFSQTLRRSPFTLINQATTKIGERVAGAAQNLTFGGQSAVIIKFRPNAPSAVVNETLDKLKVSGMPDLNPAAIPDPTPWKVLRRSALSLLDGGDFPSGVSAPLHGVKRLLFVDPSAVGPPPNGESFVLTFSENEILGLPADLLMVDAMDIVDVQSIDQAIADRIDPKNIPDGVSDEGYLEENGPVLSPRTGEGDPELHKPKHPDYSPADYSPISAFYQGPKDPVPQNYTYSLPLHKQALEDYELIDGLWADSKRCDHCGAAFHHGVVYLHEPSERLVHLGHICAKKSGMASVKEDPTQDILRDLSQRWNNWYRGSSGSFLWRVGRHLAKSADRARGSLAKALKDFERDPQHSIGEDAEARERLRLWAQRSALAGLIFLGVLVLSIFIDSLSPWWIALAGGAMVFSLLARLALMTRDLARLQTQLTKGDRDRRVALLRVGHFSSELARLTNALEQFGDWQAIIRTVSHTPFGSLNTPKKFEEDVDHFPRPQSFIYGKAKPSAAQLTEAQLNAREMTMHKGWLSTIYEGSKEEWSSRYQSALLFDSAPEPEVDNSPKGTIQGRDSTHHAVLSARQDFRLCLGEGILQASVVEVHKKAITAWMGEKMLNDLLGPVHVEGPGLALNGMMPTEFLEGILIDLEEEPLFDVDLFGFVGKGLQHRSNNVKLTRPHGEQNRLFALVNGVDLERDLIFATYRVVFSDPIPPEELRGWGDGDKGPEGGGSPVSGNPKGSPQSPSGGGSIV